MKTCMVFHKQPYMAEPSAAPSQTRPKHEPTPQSTLYALHARRKGRASELGLARQRAVDARRGRRTPPSHSVVEITGAVSGPATDTRRGAVT
jgi:hypothetical protein